MKRYHRKEERGIALALVAMFLGVIFAMMVIAVDVGRFAHTGSEVQAIADLSALSGARSVLVRGPGTAQSGADAAARQNVADGRTFVDDGTGGVLQVVEGCYTPPASNCSTNCQGSFNGPQAPPCPAGPPQQFQAVKVTATRNGVNVLTAALIPINVGLTSLNITKQAIAAIVGVNAVGPGLPITLCPELLAKLQPGQTCVQDAVLQQIALVPTGSQNSCYSSLTTSSANNGGTGGSTGFRYMLPPECGGVADRPVVSLGENISVQSGADASFLQSLKNCVASGVHDFVVPVVQCGNCTGPAQVLDFVTLHIADPSQVVASGAAANKGIHNATQVCDNTLPASSGSINSGLYASRQVTLVQ